MRFSPTTSTCEFCQTTFLATRQWQRFCSNRCRVGWHQEQKNPAVLQKIIKDLQGEIELLEAQIEQLQEKLASKGRVCSQLNQELAKTAHRKKEPKPFNIDYIRQIVDGG